ncbi:lysophospholipase [Porifericola rhodea]|uniref:alpha/beta hydrolase n=1 Tax=Porifericola rhodea TaxID=930972 RepID=UPI002666F763|nr:alpha/beta hydrolase [Porifericola rhodea]WKN33701.1 lysophospholipase [Porifericola rhodea]
MPYHNSQNYFHSSTDQCRCFWQKWIPDVPIQRVLVFHHGLGEHSGRYQNLLNYFEGSGTAFYAMEARGHGRSEGKRGHVKPLILYAYDLEDFMQIVLEDQQTDKVFLMGHSLGGMIAALYASLNQNHLKGLILSSAGIEVYMTPYLKVAKGASKILASLLPSLTLGANLNQKYLSHDPQVIEDYQADPLVHGMASASLGYELFKVHKYLYEHAPEINVPLYVMHGNADRITSPEGSKKFYELAGSTDKSLRLYDKLYHEMMNELTEDREKVLDDLKKWVLAH